MTLLMPIIIIGMALLILFMSSLMTKAAQRIRDHEALLRESCLVIEQALNSSLDRNNAGPLNIVAEKIRNTVRV
jgi:hypothetical protein